MKFRRTIRAVTNDAPKPVVVFLCRVGLIHVAANADDLALVHCHTSYMHVSVIRHECRHKHFVDMLKQANSLLVAFNELLK